MSVTIHIMNKFLKWKKHNISTLGLVIQEDEIYKNQ
jgi:hypothetical protein